MNSRLLFSAALLVGMSAFAEDAPAPAPAPLAGYHLKNRSSFDPGLVKRPPFWPIGWVHHERGQQQEVVKVNIDAKMFAVTSIMVGHPSLAVINGRSYGEGDLLRTSRGKSPDPAAKPGAPAGIQKIRVQKITDGSVTLISDDQTVTIPLKRPELNEHKSDKEEDALLGNQ